MEPQMNTDEHRSAQPQPNSSPSRFLRVLRAFAVKPRIHREAAKSAKSARISRRKILSCQQRIFGLVLRCILAATKRISPQRRGERGGRPWERTQDACAPRKTQKSLPADEGFSRWWYGTE